MLSDQRLTVDLNLCSYGVLFFIGRWRSLVTHSANLSHNLSS